MKRTLICLPIIILAAVSLMIWRQTYVENDLPVGERSSSTQDQGASAVPTSAVSTGAEQNDLGVPVVTDEEDFGGYERGEWDLTRSASVVRGKLELCFYSRENGVLRRTRVEGLYITQLLRKGEEYQSRYKSEADFVKAGEEGTYKGAYRTQIALANIGDRTRALYFGRRYLVRVFPMGFNGPVNQYHPSIGFTVIEIPDKLPKGKMLRYNVDVNHQDPIAVPKSRTTDVKITFAAAPKVEVFLASHGRGQIKLDRSLKHQVRVMNAGVNGEAVLTKRGCNYAWLYVKKLGKGPIELPRDADAVFAEEDFKEYRLKTPSIPEGSPGIGLLYEQDDHNAVFWTVTKAQLPLAERGDKPAELLKEVKINFTPGTYYVGYWSTDNRMIAVGKVTLPKEHDGSLLEMAPLKE